MNKKWEVVYKSNNIRVENSWFSGERLFVNDKLQDEQVGPASRCRLYGHILNEFGEKERIKVSIGGWFTISCLIFIDDNLVSLKNKNS